MSSRAELSSCSTIIDESDWAIVPTQTSTARRTTASSCIRSTHDKSHRARAIGRAHGYTPAPRNKVARVRRSASSRKQSSPSILKAFVGSSYRCINGKKNMGATVANRLAAAGARGRGAEWKRRVFPSRRVVTPWAVLDVRSSELATIVALLSVLPERVEGGSPISSAAARIAASASIRISRVWLLPKNSSTRCGAISSGHATVNATSAERRHVPKWGSEYWLVK
mmetsp:Transcript_20894/g.63911  ORF Transcript_20894/g.63911 Transcript_20894/m.63911 type:complete len:225 (+) Transcript_20894:235-909(+)